MNVAAAALLAAAPPYPRRVVCLTEETTETLYRIGAAELVVGVSGFTVRPPEARRKPRVSSFLSADAEAILALRPDLVVGFSDLQADIARDLVKRGVPVLVTNQRSVAEILQTVRLVTAAVGRAEAGAALRGRPRRGPRAPRRRGGGGCRAGPASSSRNGRTRSSPGSGGCRSSSSCAAARTCARRAAPPTRRPGRIFDPAEVARRDPEVVIASWCGKKARREIIAGRPGFAATRAVRHDQLYEVKSALILQPGPAALTDGAAQLGAIIAAVARGETLAPRRAGELRVAG